MLTATTKAKDAAAPAPATPPEVTPALHDLRFCALLGAGAWASVPPAVRARFSRRLGPGVTVTYAGTVIRCRMSRAGWLLAQACRLFGAALPLDRVIGVPALVTLTEEAAQGGQVWTRLYGRPRGFPQVIHSRKRFSGPTGLEEYLGGGFGIALRVSADIEGLRFHSDHYFLAFGALRLRLPAWLSPGEMTVSHIDRPDGWFAFVLELRHSRLGELIHQTGLFRERRGDDQGDIA